MELNIETDSILDSFTVITFNSKYVCKERRKDPSEEKYWTVEASFNGQEIKAEFIIDTNPLWARTMVFQFIDSIDRNVTR